MADRDGTEPATARSPLRLRMVLAAFGGVVCTGVAVVAWSLRGEGHRTAMTVVMVVAVAAAGGAGIDLLVVRRRWRHRRR